MAKKKNRKKEMRHAKHNGDNIIQFSDFQSPNSLSQLSQTDMRKALELTRGFFVTDDEFYIDELRELLYSAGSKDAETEWFEEIMEISQKKHRIRELKKLLATYPHYLDAKFQLLLETGDGVIDRAYLEKMLVIQDEIVEQWAELDYSDWFSIEARSVLQMLGFLTEIYLLNGFSNLALKLVELLRSKIEEGFPPGYFHTMLATYLNLYQFDEIESLYQWSLEKNWEDDGVLVYQIMAQLLQGKFTKAEELFKRLADLNSKAVEAFQSDSWLDLVSVSIQLTFYKPYTVHSIYIALNAATMFLETKPFLVEGMVALAESYANTLPNSPKKFRKFLEEPFLEGIGHSRAINLFYGGIHSKADFKKKTEQEILSIKGIGPGTIKKLKENGVVFKKEN
ncbi:TPA: hypothetical protein ACGPA4_001135 [Streptococcus suis]